MRVQPNVETVKYSTYYFGTGGSKYNFQFGKRIKTYRASLITRIVALQSFDNKTASDNIRAGGASITIF